MSQVDEKQWIFRFEELNQDKFPAVGRKCANLGEMTLAGLPVPPGFALSVDAYLSFLQMTGLADKITEYLKQFDLSAALGYTHYQEIGNELRAMINEQKMPTDMANVICRYYGEVAEKSRVEHVPVAIRSSGPVSMPGQFETYLNVRGEDNVINQVIRCWSSTFTTQAIAYRIQRSLQERSKAGTSVESTDTGMDITSPIGVGILSMVDARASGVAFTIHPTTGDRTKVVVEGNWGLGESVVGGGISPDRFVVDKETMHVDSTINCKTKQVVYSPEGTREEDVPAEMQSRSCLNPEELEKIVRFSLKLEQYFGAAQDVEWAIDKNLPPSDNLLLLQTRQVKNTAVTTPKVSAENIADLFIRKVFKRQA